MSNELVSGWELRQEAERRGVPVSGKQFGHVVRWGLLPERAPGRWQRGDVERLIEVVSLGKEVRQLHRRVILLRNLNWPTPPDLLRQAMIDTIPSIAAPQRKTLALYHAIQLRYGLMTEAQVARLPIPPSWRPLPTSEWQQRFRWPTSEEFEYIAGPVYTDERALRYNPLVDRSGILAPIPKEELIILLMTRQLSLPSQFPEHDV